LRAAASTLEFSPVTGGFPASSAPVKPIRKGDQPDADTPDSLHGVLLRAKVDAEH
jgi:hypothetical protein